MYRVDESSFCSTETGLLAKTVLRVMAVIAALILIDYLCTRSIPR